MILDCTVIVNGDQVGETLGTPTALETKSTENGTNAAPVNGNATPRATSSMKNLNIRDPVGEPFKFH